MRFINQAIAIIFLFFTILHPQSASGSTSFTDDKNWQVEFGPQAMYFYYEEPGLMKEYGMLYGAYLRLSENVPSLWNFEWKFSIDTELLLGQMHYDGQTWGGDPVTSESDNLLFGLRGVFGPEYMYGKTKILPFIGLGHRYFRNDDDSDGGYLREIIYLYVPIGIQVEHNLSPNWRAGLRGEFDVFLGGRVRSDLSDVDPAFDDVKNFQEPNSGFGTRGSLYLQYKANDWWLTIEPYYRYWKVEDSELSDITVFGGIPIGTGLEPKNETHQIGLMIGFVF